MRSTSRRTCLGPPGPHSTQPHSPARAPNSTNQPTPRHRQHSTTARPVLEARHTTTATTMRSWGVSQPKPRRQHPAHPYTADQITAVSHTSPCHHTDIYMATQRASACLATLHSCAAPAGALALAQPPNPHSTQPTSPASAPQTHAGTHCLRLFFAAWGSFPATRIAFSALPCSFSAN